MQIGLGLGIPGQHKRGASPPSPAALIQESGDALLLEGGGAVLRDTGIPGCDAAEALSGEEWTVIVQSGATVKVSTATLREYLING